MPNFLLAAPVLALALACVAAYARRRPRLLLAGGFAWGGRAAAGPSVLTAARGAEAEHTVAGAPGAATPLGRTVVTRRMAAAQRVSTAAGAGDAELVRGVPVRQPGLRDVAESGGGARREEDAEGDAGFLAPGLAVFIYPLAFSAGCALLVMHVQVRLVRVLIVWTAHPPARAATNVPWWWCFDIASPGGHALPAVQQPRAVLVRRPPPGAAVWSGRRQGAGRLVVAGAARRGPVDLGVELGLRVGGHGALCQLLPVDLKGIKRACLLNWHATRW